MAVTDSSSRLHHRNNNNNGSMAASTPSAVKDKEQQKVAVNGNHHHPVDDDECLAEGPVEFGGPWGCFWIIVFSHVTVLYMFGCLHLNKGGVLLPADGWTTPMAVVKLFADIWHAAVNDGSMWKAATVYMGFLILHAILYLTMPGLKIKGRVLPKTGEQLIYNCNGPFSFWMSNAVLAALHYTGVFRLSEIMDNLGALVVVSILAGDFISLAVFYYAKFTNDTHRLTGVWIYDIFLGGALNPRIGNLDFKLLFETRIAWVLLLYVTLGAAAKQYEVLGTVTPSMMVMVLAHFLYANACMKGEQFVTTTWDFFAEKWGWLLCFWNSSGVPFVYCFQSVFILQQGDTLQLPKWWTNTLFVVLLAAYYVWDTANCQKNSYRAIEEGNYVPRPWAFPQLPGGVLTNPKTLKTSSGSTLLVDGWWRYCRKPHYTADLVMALCWGLSCGVTHFLPFFYLFFFIGVLWDREKRDAKRCAKKYGKDWEKYVKLVPDVWFPGFC